MTSEQHSPNSTPEQPDTRGAVPADGQPAPADRGVAPAGVPEVDAAPAAEAPGAAPAASVAAPTTEAPAYREVTVRRAPKFVPFMAIGAILGFLAALVVAYTGPADPTLTRESILGFFTVAFAIPGLLLAALLVLIFDRRSVRKAERARAERTYDDDAA
ncbi:hypothetical protein [Arthrobacter sp. NamB2]|uniref:hypothetical protein n=1 Tax=Arthrobacter sp. NamB2 TaxID=2576035 RepID=UPI001CB9CFDB|nr:hypothetical protein [Arthrobacter sp. NamB2]